MADSQAKVDNSAGDIPMSQRDESNDSAGGVALNPAVSEPPVDAEDTHSTSAAVPISAQSPPPASSTAESRETSQSPSQVRSQGAASALQRPAAEGASSDTSAVVGDALPQLQERLGNQAPVAGESSPPSLDSNSLQPSRDTNDSSPSRARRVNSGGVFGGEEGSSAPSHPSPERNRPLVATGVGLGALDVGPNAADELVVSVPSYQEHLTSDGQRYTTYEIVVRMGGKQWSVRRRYSQFAQFRQSLRRQHKEVGSFRFPNKSKFNTFAEHTKERRRTGFDEFLRLVAGLHPRPQEVDVFLAMDEHGAGVSARAGSRPVAWTTGNVSPVATSPIVPALGGSPRPGAESEAAVHRLPSGPGAGHTANRGAAPRIPRFPPLADQLDLMLKRLLGPDVMSVLGVVAVSTVTIVAVWKVGGRSGIMTLVIGVGVGLVFQSWTAAQEFLNKGLDLVGMSTAVSQSPSPTPTPARSIIDRSPSLSGHGNCVPMAFTAESPPAQGH